mmetsp:Transcript_10213/g.15391  ORF Transcript_10213/g.15391 Transcript_10213/m.15391 type:complete len:271 (-) Transcript_10213:423-1235(-)
MPPVIVSLQAKRKPCSNLACAELRDPMVHSQLLAMQPWVDLMVLPTCLLDSCLVSPPRAQWHTLSSLLSPNLNGNHAQSWSNQDRMLLLARLLLLKNQRTISVKSCARFILKSLRLATVPTKENSWHLLHLLNHSQTHFLLSSIPMTHCVLVCSTFSQSHWPSIASAITLKVSDSIQAISPTFPRKCVLFLSTMENATRLIISHVCPSSHPTTSRKPHSSLSTNKSTKSMCLVLVRILSHARLNLHLVQSTNWCNSTVSLDSKYPKTFKR